MRALYLYSVDEDRTRQISDGMYSEYQPAFLSGTDNCCTFLGDREFAPQISQREWNYAVNRTTGIFALALNASVDKSVRTGRC